MLESFENYISKNNFVQGLKTTGTGWENNRLFIDIEITPYNTTRDVGSKVLMTEWINQHSDSLMTTDFSDKDKAVDFTFEFNTDFYNEVREQLEFAYEDIILYEFELFKLSNGLSDDFFIDVVSTLQFSEVFECEMLIGVSESLCELLKPENNE